MTNPLLKQIGIVGRHQLKATTKVWFDPTVKVLQTLGQHAAMLSEPAIDRTGITILITLNDHEKHSYASLSASASNFFGANSRHA
jgi:hypothetical protein